MAEDVSKLIDALDAEVLRATAQVLTPSARTTIAERIVYTIESFNKIAAELRVARDALEPDETGAWLTIDAEQYEALVAERNTLLEEVEHWKQNCESIDESLECAHQNMKAMNANGDKLRAEIATLRAQIPQWVRVQVFGARGCEEVEGAEYPNDGDWILVEIESATGITYKAERHTHRSWNSFGVRWQAIAPPEDQHDRQ